MIGLDTNILVRHFMQDDPKQIGPAAHVMKSLSAAEPGWVGLAVVAELVWVLKSIYRVERPAIVYVLESLLASDDCIVEQSETVLNAVNLYRNRGADFHDCLIAAGAHAAGCTRVVTFDRAAARDAGMELVS